MKKKIHFIINPKSGVESKDKIPLFIENCLNHNKFYYEIKYTQFPKHAIELTKEAINEGVDIVCAVGGDGSVHEVASTLINTKICLAIIPLGSGNGLARHLKIPLEIEKSIETINNCHFDTIDTIKMNDLFIIGTAGFGFDALIAEKFNSLDKRGFWSYVKIVFKEFFNYQSTSYKIIVDDIEIEDEYLMCCVANSSEFGNGFCISPNSIINDGLFEICLIKPFSKRQIVPILRKFFNKTIHTSKNYKLISTAKARIIRKEKRIHIDGEALEMNSIIDLMILSNSLNVIVNLK